MKPASPHLLGNLVFIPANLHPPKLSNHGKLNASRGIDNRRSILWSIRGTNSCQGIPSQSKIIQNITISPVTKNAAGDVQKCTNFVAASVHDFREISGAMPGYINDHDHLGDIHNC